MAGMTTPSDAGSYLWLFSGAPRGSFVLGAVWAAGVAWYARLGVRPIGQYILLCALSYAFAFLVFGSLFVGLWSGPQEGYSALVLFLIAGPILVLLEWSPFVFLAWLTFKSFRRRRAV